MTKRTQEEIGDQFAYFYGRVIGTWSELQEKVEDYRAGQHFMNMLLDEYPEIYDEIVGTEDDCFYDSDKLSTTIAVVLTKLGVLGEE